MVNIDRSRLEGAPTYASSDIATWDDPAYGRRINDYYGVLSKQQLPRFERRRRWDCSCPSVPGPIKVTPFGWPRKPRPALTGPARDGVRFAGSGRKNARGAVRTKNGTANPNRWLYGKIRLALTTDHWAIQSVAPVERAEPRPITIRLRRTTNGRGCNFRMPSAARIQPTMRGPSR